MVQFLCGDGNESPRGEVRLQIDNSPAGEAFRAREPVILEQMQGSRFAPETIRHLTSLGMQSGCWVPLINRGESIGMMMVASRFVNAFSLREADMLAQIADHVAMAVDNAAAFRQIADLRDRLSQEKNISKRKSISRTASRTLSARAGDCARY
jgi:formate hydrogenlyase transcriptional activator